MLPTPARNDWSVRSGFRRPLRRRMSRRKSRTVKSSSSGSGPTDAKTDRPPISSTSSPLTGSRVYSPIFPNLRMSRKRSSRPSASSRTRRTYGSSGSSAGTTKIWPVIFRWIVRAASPLSSTTICLPRRPTASTERPVTPSANATGSCARNVRTQFVRAPTIVAPTIRGRRSRATVSTSGSSGIGPAR